MWLGWAAFYGSAWVSGVVAGMIVFSKSLVGAIVRREERDLEARFGEQYRAYANRVPRWI
jgi:protein-S-isoprenylcysteine O-methyltransferase Ste14